MVTLQILVLSFLVRIQVAQLKREQHHVVLFFLLGYLILTALAVEPIPYKKSAGQSPSNKSFSYRLNQRAVRIR